LIETDVNKDLI